MAKKESKTKRLVLFDAHAIIHRAYHALPEFTSSKGEPTGALYGLSSMLIRIINDLKPDFMAAAYDLPDKTFRHEAYDEYKAGRAKADPALISQLNSSRDIFKSFNIPIYDQPGFEADDILGTIVEQMKKQKDLEIVIASGDMDTMQLVDGEKVKVYTLKKGINDTILYDEKAVVDRFGFVPKLLPDYKGLRGDPSDNIIGIKGIGEKTATELIQKFGTVEDIYKKLKKDEKVFEKEGIKTRIIELLKANEEEALFSKTLAEIRRDAPISFSLPEREWKEAVSLERIEKIFQDLDFKSLIERFHKMFSNSVGNGLSQSSGHVDSEASQASPTNLAQPDTRQSIVGSVSEEEIKKVGIALWLLNSEMTNPGLDDILDYAQSKSFEEAKDKIFSEIKKLKLEYVYNEIELPLVPILKKAEERGILIDVQQMKKLSLRYHEELTSLEKNIYKLSGGEFNINSPKQMAEVLFDKLELHTAGLKKTTGGKRSTRESELEKLKDKHPVIESILFYRELQKIISTYTDSILKIVDANNRLHTSLNQAGTTTGRMSSNNPNLQNIPARGDYAKEIRRAFIATPGCKWIACDYSQIEMRVMALFCGDENLINVFKTGGDVHSAVASRVFGVSEDKVTSDMRRKAKVINFGIIYGMGVNALKGNLGTSREEAQQFYDNYFEKFPKIREFFDRVKKETKEKGYTETLFGRRRYFPGIKSKIPFIKAMAERMAINAPLQGTAADIIKIAMQKVDAELKEKKLDDKVHFLLQVHDELIYEAEDDVVKEATEIIKTVMENAVESRLALRANIYIGSNWGELE